MVLMNSQRTSAGRFLMRFIVSMLLLFLLLLKKLCLISKRPLLSWMLFLKLLRKVENLINANEVLDGGKNRYIAYEEAFYTPHHNNPLVIIGKQFSEFCDCEMDLDLITTGGIIFGATLASVSEFIQSYKIDCVK